MANGRKHPTVSDILNKKIDISVWKERDRLDRQSFEILAQLFDDMKTELLQKFDPNADITGRKVEQLVADTIRPIVELCTDISEPETLKDKERALENLDEFIGQCRDQFVPGYHRSARAGDMVYVDETPGRLANLVTRFPDRYKEASAKGLEGIGRDLATHN